ncbi:MAG TPA: hypothetical protein VIJ64_10725 [Candidatus Lustribacter sp.]
MFTLAALAAAIVAAAIFVVASLRLRAAEKVRPPPRSKARRQPQLEDAIRAAFDGPGAKHGQLFLSYSVWKRDRETRLELLAADPFGRLNEFTRCLVVRHLWRALEHLAAGSVVLVDNPPQTWTQSIDAAFHDHGIDPWRLPPAGLSPAPQFAEE